MKVVFLDVDGVLNNEFTTESIMKCRGIDDELVANLATIVRITGAEIVLVSDWKMFFDSKVDIKDATHPMLRYLMDKLQKYDLYIYDYTIDRNASDRGYGIQRWLKRFPEVERWVVLDHKFFFDYEEAGVVPHLVLTNGICGLTESDVANAIEILTKKRK